MGSVSKLPSGSWDGPEKMAKSAQPLSEDTKYPQHRHPTVEYRHLASIRDSKVVDYGHPEYKHCPTRVPAERLHNILDVIMRLTNSYQIPIKQGNTGHVKIVWPPYFETVVCRIQQTSRKLRKADATFQSHLDPRVRCTLIVLFDV